jgi:CheY-like chemotaxis protein
LDESSFAVRTGAPAPLSILVAEDDEGSRESLAALLRASGYSVRAAADGAEALTLAGELAPDLVLTDICMPGISGVELCQHLRRAPGARPVAIFAVTALAKEMWTDFEEVGFDAIFGKPLDYDALALRLAQQAETVSALPAVPHGEASAACRAEVAQPMR